MDDCDITAAALAAKRGDRAAAERFITATQAQLQRMLGYLVSPGHAEDLAQETYLRAFAALGGYAQRSPARMWLLAIARRVAADHLRKRGRSPQAAVTEDWLAAAEQAGAIAADHQPALVLRGLILALDVDRREAFVLTQVLGLSYAEAAELSGAAVGTIRSRVFRARAELVQACREDTGGEASASS
ncbi:MAG: sigma-70 family RNA polymerase sigma factor [Sciscionella sp.]